MEPVHQGEDAFGTNVLLIGWSSMSGDLFYISSDIHQHLLVGGNNSYQHLHVQHYLQECYVRRKHA